MVFLLSGLGFGATHPRRLWIVNDNLSWSRCQRPRITPGPAMTRSTLRRGNLRTRMR